MTDIRRVVVPALHELQILRVAPPVARPGEVLVRTTFSGVCGSDTHAWNGRHPNIALPYAPGHEVVGVVEKVGDGVTSVRAGDRIVVEPTLPCWTCKQCVSGRENLCERLVFFGCGYAQGGMADLFTVAANRLHTLPDDLDDLSASLVEPLATPLHAARLAGDLTGKSVAVIGAGTIGLLMLAVARARGARTVVSCDLLQLKRDLALSLGADAVVDPADADAVLQVRESLGESADVVFDCVAVQTSVVQGVQMALKGGTVVIVGVPSKDVVVPLPVIQDQQVRIQGSATYLPEDFHDAIAVLQSGAVKASDMISAQFPLEEAAEAFAASNSGRHIKVLVAP